MHLHPPVSTLQFQMDSKKKVLGLITKSVPTARHLLEQLVLSATLLHTAARHAKNSIREMYTKKLCLTPYERRPVHTCVHDFHGGAQDEEGNSDACPI